MQHEAVSKKKKSLFINLLVWEMSSQKVRDICRGNVIKSTIKVENTDIRTRT